MTRPGRGSTETAVWISHLSTFAIHVDDASARFPGKLVQELAPRLRTLGNERWGRSLPVLGALPRDPVTAQVRFQHAPRHRIDAQRIQPEDLRAQRRRRLRVAMPLAQLRCYLERAERPFASATNPE